MNKRQKRIQLFIFLMMNLILILFTMVMIVLNIHIFGYVIFLISVLGLFIITSIILTIKIQRLNQPDK